MKIFQGQSGLWGIERDGAVMADATFDKNTAIVVAEFGEQVWQFCTEYHSEDEGNPLFGALIYDDPRAGLRRCIVDGDDSEVFFYHGCYTDANRDECAKLEYQDGRTREAYWVDIQFVDVEGEG